MRYTTLPYPTLPHPTHPTLPYPTPPHPTPPHPHPTPPHPTHPTHPTPPYPTLPYPTLPYFTLPYPTLPYPTLPYPIPTLSLPYPYPIPTLSMSRLGPGIPSNGSNTWIFNPGNTKRVILNLFVPNLSGTRWIISGEIYNPWDFNSKDLNQNFDFQIFKGDQNDPLLQGVHIWSKYLVFLELIKRIVHIVYRPDLIRNTRCDHRPQVGKPMQSCSMSTSDWYQSKSHTFWRMLHSISIGTLILYNYAVYTYTLYYINFQADVLFRTSNNWTKSAIWSPIL